MVKGILRKYNRGEVSGMKIEEEESKEETKQVIQETKEAEFVPTGPNYFDIKLRKDTICYLFDFLDPASLMRAGRVCKTFYQVTQIPLLYKKFCKANYKSSPPLPSLTPFSTIVKRINNSTFGEFSNAVKNQANQDIRSLIWLPSLKDYATPPQFYNQFKDYKELYLKAPRIRYGGVYMMKEKYVRQGTRAINQMYDPYHEVEFYRYFRFFPEGLIMSCLCVNKLNKEKIKRLLSIKQVQSMNDDDSIWYGNGVIKSLIFGEYIVQKSKLFIKLSSKTTIYEFELDIESSQPGMFDGLKMKNQSMRIVGNPEPTPIEHDYQGDKTFKFIRVSSLLSELEGNWPNIAI